MALSCRECGVVLRRRDYVPGRGRICPTCRTRQAQAGERRDVRRDLVWCLLVAAFVIIQLSSDGGPWRWTDVPVIAVLVPLLVVPHELGHAWACRMVGGHVMGIHLGMGRRARRRWFLGVPWRLRSVPVRGATYCNLLTPRDLRTRDWLVVAAGPGTHLFFGIAALAALLASDAPADAWFARDLAVAAGIGLVVNLWPSVEGDFTSDGLGLLRIPSLPREAKVPLLLTAYDWTHRDVEPGPDAARVAAEMRRLLRRSHLPPYGRAFLEATLAWCLLLDDGDLDEALELSLCASRRGSQLTLDPERPERSLSASHSLFPAVVGCATVLSGERRVGTKLIMLACAGIGDVRLEALYRCFAARGAAREGHARAFQWHLAAARRLDPRCPLLAAVSAETP